MPSKQQPACFCVADGLAHMNHFCSKKLQVHFSIQYEQGWCLFYNETENMVKRIQKFRSNHFQISIPSAAISTEELWN